MSRYTVFLCITSNCVAGEWIDCNPEEIVMWNGNARSATHATELATQAKLHPNYARGRIIRVLQK